MEYRKPTMKLFQVDEKDIICSSTLITAPDIPFPGEGEDGENW